MITVLAGGVGASRFLSGLVRVVPPEEITVIVNTGDDLNLLGLHVSPDVDTILYCLSGIQDIERGWGIRGETFRCNQRLGSLGIPNWFQIGDQDLATHLIRTELLRKGSSLTEATDELRRRMGIKTRVLPMSDGPVTTYITTNDGEMDLQRYLIATDWKSPVKAIQFKGIKTSWPTEDALNAIRNAHGIVFPPSNPFVSIGPILALNGMRSAVQKSKVVKIGVSPLIGDAPVKGPLHRMMDGLGFPRSVAGIAEIYKGLLNALVIDPTDARLSVEVEQRGIRPVVAEILLDQPARQKNLAQLIVKELNLT